MTAFCSNATQRLYADILLEKNGELGGESMGRERKREREGE